MAAEAAPGVGPLIKLFQMQARDMRVAAHAQDLSESDSEPLKNKHQTLRVMEAGRSLGCPWDICVAVNICFILKEGKLGRKQTPLSFIHRCLCALSREDLQFRKQIYICFVGLHCSERKSEADTQ